MNHVWLLLGANLGNEIKLFEQACKQIENKIGVCVNKSHIYTSPPWGFEHTNMFYNQALHITTLLSADEVLHKCLLIEYVLGRTRNQTHGYEARIIDIDILYFNNDIIQTPELDIPHKLLHKRKFTLVPLCEIASDYVHPILQLTNQKLLAMCEDDAEITRCK